MDDYEQCTPGDGGIIRKALEKKGAVVFPLAIGNHTVLTILLTQNFSSIGIIPGGRPEGRIYVSVMGHGLHHFKPEETHWGYFQEKLDLAEEEAKVLEELWTNIWAKTEEEKFVGQMFDADRGVNGNI
jgi:hypothetical protein